MIVVLMIGVIGLVGIYLGYLISVRKKVSLLHDYHYDKVSEADMESFCRWSGAGVMVIGAGLLVTAMLLYLTDSAWSFMAFAAGFVSGLAMLIRAGIKYNHS